MKLGDGAKDSVSGFVGTLTGRCEYLHGSTQLQITATQVNNDNEVVSNWFDESRVVPE